MPERSNAPMAGWFARAAPGLDDFAEVAEAAFGRLPAQFRQLVGDVVFHVQEFADEEVLESLGIKDPFELTGLYDGIDLADRLARRRAGTPPAPMPGLPGPPSAEPVTRPVLPFEGKGHLGVLSVKGNDVFWNGERIAPQEELLLAEACRQGLKDAGVLLPAVKPATPKP